MADDPNQAKSIGSNWTTQRNIPVYIVRGDFSYITFAHGSLAAEISEIKFTARKRLLDDKGYGAPVIEITLDATGQWDVSTDYQGILRFYDYNSSGLRQSNGELELDYDIQITPNDGKLYTVQEGPCYVIAEATHDDSLAAYPSYSTLGDLQDEIEQYAAGLHRTFLSAAAVTGATDIDVEDAAALAGATTIGITLDDGSVDEFTPDTITDNNIDFSTSHPGGLTGDAAIRNVVMEVE